PVVFASVVLVIAAGPIRFAILPAMLTFAGSILAMQVPWQARVHRAIQSKLIDGGYTDISDRCESQSVVRSAHRIVLLAATFYALAIGAAAAFLGVLIALRLLAL